MKFEIEILKRSKVKTSREVNDYPITLRLFILWKSDYTVITPADFDFTGVT